MLKYRLETLKDIVDTFVLVEATHTFSGKKKALYYEENKQLFENFNDKILHLHVNDSPLQEGTKKKEQTWENEYHQRKCIHVGLNHLNLNPEDIVLISDVDEIPDPNTLEKVKRGEIVITLNSLKQDLYYYNLETKPLTDWLYPKIFQYGFFMENNYSCDQIRWVTLPYIEKGGWHLSYFGDEKFIENKIQSFSHQEFNDEKFTSQELILERKQKKKDPFDRKYNPVVSVPLYANPYLPPRHECWNKFLS
jgi:beta-1,4-mannosyl-glycoprotein beta-1,4-N-acetylglucosaminyltransferase